MFSHAAARQFLENKSSPAHSQSPETLRPSAKRTLTLRTAQQRHCFCLPHRFWEARLDFVPFPRHKLHSGCHRGAAVSAADFPLLLPAGLQLTGSPSSERRARQPRVPARNGKEPMPSRPAPALPRSHTAPEPSSPAPPFFSSSFPGLAG